MFCYIIDIVIWQIGFFATCPKTYIYDVDSMFVYFYFVYPIYIQNSAGRT